MLRQNLMLESCSDLKTGFRARLRAETEIAHVASEMAFKPFLEDLSGALDWFLASQRSAFGALLESLDEPTPDPTSALIAPVIDYLDHDLRERGIRAEILAPKRKLDSLAISYLTLGSRHGTAVLRRRLEAAGLSTQIPTYFTRSTTPSTAWDDVCVALDAVAPDSAYAQRLIRDTRMGYGLFRRAAALNDQQRGRL